MTNEKRKILMVDDDTLMLSAMKRLLEDTGRYEVRTISKPENARAAAREFMPNLIVLDVIMPAMDGGDVATALKEDQRLKDIPVLFLTSMVSKDQVKKQDGVIAGHPFVAKPAPLPELIKRIEECLDAGSTRTQ